MEQFSMFLRTIHGDRRRELVLRLGTFFCVSVLMMAGCGVPPQVQQTRDAPLFDDIRNIMATVRAKPWLNFDPSNPEKVNGIAINIALISARTQKGVFGAGVIRAVMYEDVSGEPQRSSATSRGVYKDTGKILYQWDLPAEKAMMYRVMRRPNRSYAIGDAYQLRLSWGNLDLRGKRVAIVLEYHRQDGIVVVRKPFHLKIPESA
jgi:hypothetical protein